MDRAYSVLHVKSVEEGSRIIRGIATTPTPDRVGDIVEPMGVDFKNPMPLLWQHKSDKPVGIVTFDKPTKNGIAFEAKLANITEPGALKDRVDEAWQSVKAGLVRAVSIGFRAMETAFIEATGGVRFIKSEVFELSLVTIPANAEATITSIKSIDSNVRAALGIRDVGTDRPVHPALRDSTTKFNPNRPMEGKMNTSEKITALEAQRTETIKSWESLKNLDTKTAEQKASIKQYMVEIEALDEELEEEKAFEKAIARRATPIERTAATSAYTVPATVAKKEEPGIPFTRIIKVKANAEKFVMPMAEIAKRMYGQDSQTYQLVTKANEVVPGSIASGNWAVDLVSPEGAAAADFVEWLRAEMIVGKFGTNGIPALRRIPFYSPYVTQTAAATGAWVGEGKAKPLSRPDFDRSQLLPLKMAIISVLTERNIRDSSPNSDMVIRNELRDCLVQLEDETFITPGNSGSSNVKPASITNGAEAIVATGTGDADDIRLDIRALVHKFTTAHNKPRTGVIIMSTDSAMALGTMTNALGQPEFPGIGMDGGRLAGFPVIVSDYAGTNVVMVNASDIFYADEGGVTVDFSREASLEMRDDGHLTMDGSTGTGFASVSMFQTNMVAFRAEKTTSWKRRRTQSVAYLTSVAWGGAVPES